MEVFGRVMYFEGGGDALGCSADSKCTEREFARDGFCSRAVVEDLKGAFHVVSRWVHGPLKMVCCSEWSRSRRKGSPAPALMVDAEGLIGLNQCRWYNEGDRARRGKEAGCSER